MGAEPMDIDVKMNMALEDIIAQSGSKRTAAPKKMRTNKRKESASSVALGRPRAAGVKKPKGARFANNRQRSSVQVSPKGGSLKRESGKSRTRVFQETGKRVYVGAGNKNSYVLVKQYRQQPQQRQLQQRGQRRPGYRAYKGVTVAKQFQQQSYRAAGLYQPPAIRSQPFQQLRSAFHGQQPRSGSFGWASSRPKGKAWFASRRGSTGGQSYGWR